jgi:hypothetical protein
VTPLADRLRRLGAARYLPVFGTMPQARAAVDTRSPLTDALRLRLSSEPSAASLARDLIGEACHAWGLVPLLHAGRAVMSELVSNAVEHAGGEILVTLSKLGRGAKSGAAAAGTGLHLAVRDRNPRLPHLLDLAPVVPGRPLDERGRGLRIVHAAATAWGAIPTPGGKVVWAAVRSRPDLLLEG